MMTPKTLLYNSASSMTQEHDSMRNNYLALVVNPFTADAVPVPDFQPTGARYCRRLLYNEVMLGSTEYLFVLHPYSNKSQVSKYLRATTTDTGYGWLPGLRPIQKIGDWIWAGSISAEENLALNYDAGRTVSMGFEVVSDTISAGNFTVSGQMHGVNCPQLFDFRQLSGMQMATYRQDDQSLIIGAKAADGIVGICAPMVSPVVPFDDSTFECGGTRYSMEFLSNGPLASNLLVAKSGGSPSRVLKTFPNQVLTATEFSTFLVPGVDIPFGMTGRTTFEFEVNFASSAAVSFELIQVSAYFHIEADGVTPSPVPVCHSRTLYGQKVETGYDPSGTSCVTLTGEFNFPAPCLGITASCISYFSNGTQFGRLKIVNYEASRPGTQDPFTLVHVEQVDPTMRICFNATGNFEVIPSQSVQSVARDLGAGSADYYEHSDDIKAVDLVMRHKADFGLAMFSSGSGSIRGFQEWSHQVPTQGVLRGYAAGKWGMIADIARGAWNVVKPCVKDWAAKKIGAACSNRKKLGYASRRGRGFKGPGEKAERPDPPVTPRHTESRNPSPERKAHHESVEVVHSVTVRRVPTNNLEAGLSKLVEDFSVTGDDDTETPLVIPRVGRAAGKRVGFASGKSITRRRPPVIAEEAKIVDIDVPQAVAYPNFRDLTLEVSRRWQVFFSGDNGKLIRGPADALFPIVYGEEDAMHVDVVGLYMTDAPLTGAFYTSVGGDDAKIQVDVRLLDASPFETMASILGSDIDPMYFTLGEMPVDEVADTSYSLAAFVLAFGLPNPPNYVYTGVMEQGLPYGEPGQISAKAQYCADNGYTLFVGGMAMDEEGNSLEPEDHPVLVEPKTRMITSDITLRYEILTAHLLYTGFSSHPSPVTRHSVEAAIVAPSGDQVREQRKEVEAVTEKVNTNPGSFPVALQTQVRALQATIKNLTKSIGDIDNRLSRSGDALPPAKKVAAKQMKEAQVTSLERKKRALNDIHKAAGFPIPFPDMGTNNPLERMTPANMTTVAGTQHLDKYEEAAEWLAENKVAERKNEEISGVLNYKYRPSLKFLTTLRAAVVLLDTGAPPYTGGINKKTADYLRGEVLRLKDLPLDPEVAEAKANSQEGVKTAEKKKSRKKLTADVERHAPLPRKQNSMATIHAVRKGKIDAHPGSSGTYVVPKSKISLDEGFD